MKKREERCTVFAVRVSLGALTSSSETVFTESMLWLSVIAFSDDVLDISI